MILLNRAGRPPLTGTEIRRLLLGAGLALGAPEGEVAVVLMRDGEIRRLNCEFRGVDRPTDVLSFPDGAVGEPGSVPRIGDIVISLPTARRNARRVRHAPRVEVSRLLIHGFLHLLGYDHEVDGGDMAELETVLRATLGIP